MAMAATNLPGLHVTAPDEDMEISSDYERIGEEIDVDIDLTVDPSHHEDEDYMLEDARSERGQEHENKDDIMLDGDGDGGYDEDGIMQDDASLPDEHLTDASEIGYVDVDVKETPQVQDVEVQDRGQGDDYIGYEDEVDVQPEDHLQATAQQPDVLPVPDEGAEVIGAETSGTQDQDREGVEAQPSEPTADAAVIEVQQSGEQRTENHVDIEQGTASHSQIEHVPTASAQETTEQDKASEQAQKAPEQTQPELEHVQTEVHDQIEVHDQTEVHGQTEVRESEQASEGTALEGSKPEQGPEQRSEQALEQGTKQSTGQSTNQVAKQGTEQSSEQSFELPPEPVEAVADFSHLPFNEHYSEADGSSDSARSMHPVIVNYHGEEIFLFPPAEGHTSETFFLSDESLAHQSIQNLFHALRVVLGNSIRDEVELEIDNAELGLCVSEDSAHAANTSIAQVLDVFIQLHHIDGVQNPDPLYVTLNTKARFSSRLNFLIEAIAESKGFSQVLLSHDDVEGDVYPEDEGDNDEQSHREPSQEYHSYDASAYEDRPQIEEGNYPNETDQSEAQASAPQVEENEVHHSQGTAFAEEQPSADVGEHGEPTSVQETVGTPHSVKSSDLPSDDDLPESENPEHQEDGNFQEPAKEPLPEDSPEDDLIDYDDAQNGADSRGDASNESSTIQGDATPAAAGSTSHPDHPLTVEETDQALATGASPPSDEAAAAKDPGAPEEPNSVHPEHDLSENVEEVVLSFDQDASQAGEGVYEPEQQADKQAEDTFEGQAEDQAESLYLPEDEDEYTDEQTLNFPDDDQGEHGQDEGDYVDVTQNAVSEEFDAGTQDAPQELSASAVDEHGLEEPFHDGVYDDADAEKIVDTVFDEAASDLGDNAHAAADDQAQSSGEAADEDDLDTIDYDDEELSEPPSPNANDNQSASKDMAPSPSSAKRGREEFDHGEEDVDNTQALKKVKSQ
ncbi:uncharacterized protein K452DRAFT_171279 [Aplosporella prunicola CBS 121167]|uniref:Uncharacterized protein n=1 Tax=Aplosporella prunicola CBS 121167 TaxID=1176127 RepID=A0A6A6BKR5_9PEZI|nr:uncharacterized protein K452DRAFT_171279 [Aplosporella prunicola CBS 121167]KAF2143447.1 hypothetical protein K452DRAFT_171279 [Aplosporella prunicola CBS 121167]